MRHPRVAGFLAGKIGFLDIARVVEETLERTPGGALSCLDDVHAADATAREVAGTLVSVSVLSV